MPAKGAANIGFGISIFLIFILSNMYDIIIT